MAQTLDENLNIIQQTPIEISYMDGDLRIIAKLDDEPNDVGGLTAEQLKAKFDEAGVIIQEYINNKLVPAILAADATEQHRAAAEQERQSNEQERVDNETARGQAFAQMEKDAEQTAALVEKLAVLANTLDAGSVATVNVAVDPVTGGYQITFGIPRGRDGDGDGDMKKAVYDPTGKATDIFKFVADQIAKIPTPDVSAQIQAHNEAADAHAGVLAPMYTYGTEDLEPGVTPLPTGQLHFVYE